MIGANIQSRRKMIGLTQEQVAERLGVSRQTVTKWETGESTPDLANAGALAEALDVSLDALVGYDPQGTVLPMPPRGKHLFGIIAAWLAANSDEDAARVQQLVPDCETERIEGGHDVHYEHPEAFVAALERATSFRR